MKYKLIDIEDNVTKMAFIRNRRQVPLCRACHDKVHAGEYNGPSLKNLWGRRTRCYDNRIVNSESYIIRGEPYEGKPLEESLMDKGWKLIKK